MHRNKRTAAVAGVVAALVLGAAACGDDQDNADPAAQTTQAKDITVWLMNGSAPDAVIKAVNADFTAAHPGTKPEKYPCASDCSSPGCEESSAPIKSSTRFACGAQTRK